MGSGIGEAAGGIGQVRGLFGKRDKSATNDMLNGKVVATGTPGAQTVADPTQGLSDAQARNRKLLQAGIGSIAGYGQQSQPMRAMQQPQINFAPQLNPPKFFGQ